MKVCALFVVISAFSSSVFAAKAPAVRFQKVLYSAQLPWDGAKSPMDFELGTVVRSGSDGRSTFVAVIREGGKVMGTCERDLKAGRAVDVIPMRCEGALFDKGTAATFSFSDSLPSPVFTTPGKATALVSGG